MFVTEMTESNTQVKFISRIVNAGTSSSGKRRHIIGVPDNETPKIADLAGKHCIVILQPIL